jgi:hypothetical protein
VGKIDAARRVGRHCCKNYFAMPGEPLLRYLAGRTFAMQFKRRVKKTKTQLVFDVRNRIIMKKKGGRSPNIKCRKDYRFHFHCKLLHLQLRIGIHDKVDRHRLYSKVICWKASRMR